MATSKNFEVKNGLSVGGTERISSAGVGTFTDLNVTGTTTTIDTATLQVQDKNIVINYGTGDTSSTASGAGITIQDAVDASNDATLLWDASADEFDFSHTVTAPSLKSTGAATFDSTLTSTGLLLSENTGLYTTNASISYYSATNGVYVNGAGNSGWLRLNASGTQNARNSIDLYGSSAGDYIKIKAANTDTMYIGANGAGRVGIGTSTPSTALQVGDGTGSPYITIDKSTTGASGILLKNAGNDKIKLLANALEEFELHVNNALAMYVKESGNVGIGGETNPDASLHITSNTPTIAFDESDASQDYRIGSYGGAFAIYDATDSAYRLVIDGSGNVGIGTTSPDTKLHIEGNSNNGDADCELVIEDLDTSSGSQVPAILFKGNGSTIGRIRCNGVQGILLSGGTTMSDDLVVTNSGVGIGTNNPSTLLHINGSGDAIRVESTNAGAGGAQMDMLHYSASPADNDVHGSINFGGYYSGSSSAYGSSIRSVWSDVSAKEAKLEFYTRDDNDFTHKMAINHTGDVHFNHLSNDFRLRGGVYGSLFDSSPNMNHNIRFHSTAGMYFNTGTTNGQFIFEQRGTGRFTIDSSGGSPSSDRKLKENIEDITYGLDTVKQLQPRKFDWKGEDIPADEKASIGFIAQEVESLIPEVVNETTHPDDPGDGSRNIKRLNYSAMTSVLVKAIQELEARVKELEG